MIGIVLADDHELVREGIASLLNMVPDFKVVSQCTNGRQLIRRIKSLYPNIAIVDVSLPELNGLDGAKYIRKINPSTRVIAISNHPDEVSMRELVNAGISGFVVKSGSVKDLIEAIRKGSAGNIYLSDEVRRRHSFRRQMNGDSDAGHALTRREREILKLIGEGNSSRHIAAMLNISETTVKTHRNHLMDKLNVRDVAGLTRESIRLRLVHVDGH
jgi:two-component system response regulator NreC